MMVDFCFISMQYSRTKNAFCLSSRKDSFYFYNFFFLEVMDFSWALGRKFFYLSFSHLNLCFIWEVVQGSVWCFMLVFSLQRYQSFSTCLHYGEWSSCSLDLPPIFAGSTNWRLLKRCLQVSKDSSYVWGFQSFLIVTLAYTWPLRIN